MRGEELRSTYLKLGVDEAEGYLSWMREKKTVDSREKCNAEFETLDNQFDELEK